MNPTSNYFINIIFINLTPKQIAWSPRNHLPSKIATKIDQGFSYAI